MRLTAIVLLIVCTAALHAANGGVVWISGHWGEGSCSQQWIQGSYVTQPATVVVVRPQPVAIQAPPPAPVWIAGGWVWINNQWMWREGYWSLPPACPPQPVCQSQPVYVEPACESYEPACQTIYEPACEPRRVHSSVSVGVGVGYGYGCGHHVRPCVDTRAACDTQRAKVPPVPFLPGSHVLPRPPKNFPDPLGVFRHDPLGWLRK